MAPIETEYGRKIVVGNETIYVHNDNLDVLVTAVRENDNISYSYRQGHLYSLSLKVETDSKDEGGIIRAKLTRSNFRIKVLLEADYTIKGDIVEQSIEVSEDLVIGFRATHRKPVTVSQTEASHTE